MKNIKFLVTIFIITLVTSSMSVFAYGTGILTIKNQTVPGFNGSWKSSPRSKITSGTQTITKVDTTRSLDVKLEYGANGSYATVSDWYLLQSGTDITFPDNGIKSWYPSFSLGDYRLYVDSRITYVNNTTINKAVYNPGN